MTDDNLKCSGIHGACLGQADEINGRTEQKSDDMGSTGSKRPLLLLPLVLMLMGTFVGIILMVQDVERQNHAKSAKHDDSVAVVQSPDSSGSLADIYHRTMEEFAVVNFLISECYDKCENEASCVGDCRLVERAQSEIARKLKSSLFSLLKDLFEREGVRETVCKVRHLDESINITGNRADIDTTYDFSECGENQRNYVMVPFSTGCVPVERLDTNAIGLRISVNQNPLETSPARSSADAGHMDGVAAVVPLRAIPGESTSHYAIRIPVKDTSRDFQVKVSYSIEQNLRLLVPEGQLVDSDSRDRECAAKTGRVGCVSSEVLFSAWNTTPYFFVNGIDKIDAKVQFLLGDVEYTDYYCSNDGIVHEGSQCANITSIEISNSNGKSVKRGDRISGLKISVKKAAFNSDMLAVTFRQ